MIDEYYFQIRVNPGMGGYWEAEVIMLGETEIIRSYSLDNLIEALKKMLDEYRRENV